MIYYKNLVVKVESWPRLKSYSSPLIDTIFAYGDIFFSHISRTRKSCGKISFIKSHFSKVIQSSLLMNTVQLLILISGNTITQRVNA